MELIKITDNGGKTMDRYTAYFTKDMMLMMSSNAVSPQGVCMSDTSKPEYMECDEGAEIKLTDCPEQVKTAIASFLKVTFTCPSCQENRLECIEAEVTATSIIEDIKRNGDFEYAKPIITDGEVDRYQCASCGYVLKEHSGELITGNEQVVDWCDNNCP